MSEWSCVFKKGGHCLIVVGDAIVSKRAAHVGDRFIDLLAEKVLVKEGWWIRTLHSTKRAFNVKTVV